MRFIYVCRSFDIQNTGFIKISAQMKHLANHGIDSIIYSISAGNSQQYTEIKQVLIPNAERSSGVISKIRRVPR